jgi:hypothetical protein
LQITLKEGIVGEREGDFGDNSRVEILANLPFLEGELSRREWKHKTFHFESDIQRK